MRRILIIRLSAIGDVAMVVPHLYAVCMANKDCEFTFLTQPFLSSLLVNAPKNLEVMTFDKKNNGSIWDLVVFANRIRKEKFDIIIDLHDVLRTKIIRYWSSFACKTKIYSIDKRRRIREKLISGCRDIDMPSISYIYREAILKANLNEIGSIKTIDINGYSPSDKLYEYLNVPVKIGLAPFASKRSKEVDMDFISQIIDYISKNTTAKIFLFCAKSEMKKAESLISRHKDTIIPICGHWGFANELFLISRLSCMVSMDSANMHLSSMVGTPVISLWAGTSPRCGFLGIGQRKADVIETNIDCAPCSVFGTDKCKFSHFNCTKNMDLDKITDRINFYIDNNSK